jgi:hypothetical protein
MRGEDEEDREAGREDRGADEASAAAVQRERIYMLPGSFAPNLGASRPATLIVRCEGDSEPLRSQARWCADHRVQPSICASIAPKIAEECRKKREAERWGAGAERPKRPNSKRPHSKRPKRPNSTRSTAGSEPDEPSGATTLNLTVDLVLSANIVVEVDGAERVLVLGHDERPREAAARHGARLGLSEEQIEGGLAPLLEARAEALCWMRGECPERTPEEYRDFDAFSAFVAAGGARRDG